MASPLSDLTVDAVIMKSRAQAQGESYQTTPGPEIVILNPVAATIVVGVVALVIFVIFLKVVASIVAKGYPHRVGRLEAAWREPSRPG